MKSQPKTPPPRFPTEEVMRNAVTNRANEFDGAFVYGVITTGVYCRPSCASGPAKARNLRFFANPAAAEAAGLRPCKRCQPRIPARDFHPDPIGYVR
jgi:AraC family transcriptional regulator, regulatory protein of adaptative response / methylated-DNA-[protein]-cysteine methyltransferase